MSAGVGYHYRQHAVYTRHIYAVGVVNGASVEGYVYTTYHDVVAGSTWRCAGVTGFIVC